MSKNLKVKALQTFEEGVTYEVPEDKAASLAVLGVVEIVGVAEPLPEFAGDKLPPVSDGSGETATVLPAEDGNDGEVKALADLTIEELKAIADAEGVTYKKNVKAADLIAAIEAKREEVAAAGNGGGE